MLERIMYNRVAAVEYAKKWALKRNLQYFDFENIGGDCTNFVSQCLYAGCKVMNFTKTYGWYYINAYERSPAWSATKYLYDFLTANTGEGPMGLVVKPEKAMLGDIVQIGNENGTFFHSMIIVKIGKNQIYVAAHSVDSYMRPINTYEFKKIRFIHIIGANKK